MSNDELRHSDNFKMSCKHSDPPVIVIPTEAGIQRLLILDSSLRWSDGNSTLLIS